MLTVKEASELLQLSPATLNRWAKMGKVPGARREDVSGHERWMFPENGLQEAMDNRPAHSIRMQQVRAQNKWGGSAQEVKAPKDADKPHAEKNDAMLTVPEAAEVVGLDAKTLYAAVKNGKLDGIKAENGKVLVYRNSLERFQAMRQHPSSKAKVMPKDRRGKKEDVSQPPVTVDELLGRLEVTVRELRYAVARERKQRSKELTAKFQQVLSDLT